MAKLICISDTHCSHCALSIPEGDILVHAGDFTSRGTHAEVVAFGNWLRTLPHTYKIVICGNHDFLGETDFATLCAALDGCIVLQDSGVEVMGLKFYGSAWTPYFGGWAFNLHRGPEIAAKWAEIPDDTEVLVTHGPPALIGDQVHREGTLEVENVGCRDLSKRIEKLSKLRAHIYGHIHEGHGSRIIGGVNYVNAAVLNDRYQISYKPITIDL